MQKICLLSIHLTNEISESWFQIIVIAIINLNRFDLWSESCWMKKFFFSFLEVQSGRVVDLLPNKYRHLGNKQTRRSFFFAHSHNVSFSFDSWNVLIYFGSILLSWKVKGIFSAHTSSSTFLRYLIFERMLFVHHCFPISSLEVYSSSHVFCWWLRPISLAVWGCLLSCFLITLK